MKTELDAGLFEVSGFELKMDFLVESPVEYDFGVEVCCGEPKGPEVLCSSKTDICSGSDRLVDGFIDEGVKFFDFRLASCRTDFRIVVFLDLVASGVK